MQTRATVWADKSGSVTLYLRGGELVSHLELTPEAAQQLARDLTKAVDALPRVASAADLGLVA